MRDGLIDEGGDVRVGVVDDGGGDGHRSADDGAGDGADGEVVGRRPARSAMARPMSWVAWEIWSSMAARSLGTVRVSAIRSLSSARCWAVRPAKVEAKAARRAGTGASWGGWAWNASMSIGS